ncbi:DUF6988 family protein [Aliamphritea spongicola]
MISLLKKSKTLMTEIDVRMNGIVIPDGLRSKISFGLLHLSLEHFGSIITLINYNMSASAVALLRCQYEALIRSLYFDQCATEKSYMNLLIIKSKKAL